MSNEQELDLPYIAIIPYKVQIDDTIPDAAKIYLGQLSALAQKYGYCWATDDQLAKAKKTSIRNIERWNTILERAGYIFRDTNNVPVKEPGQKVRWIKKRKIYVDGAWAAKKNDSAKNEESDEVPKNEESDAIPKNGGSNKEHSDKDKEQPAVVIFPELDELDISQRLKMRISSGHTQEQVAIAVKRALRWSGRPSDEVGLLSALKKADEWDDEPTAEEIEDENRKFLSTLQPLDGTVLGLYNVSIGNKYIEFYGGNGAYTLYSIEDKLFKKNVVEYIEYLKKK